MATVLVVDDDPTNREFLRTLLAYRGHRVREASDGDAALNAAGAERPDAVITDILMPGGLDGYELARQLRSRPETSAVPIAFSTAHYAEHEIRPLARACGVQGVILKPATPRVALEAIDALLSSAPQPAVVAESFAAEHCSALKTKLLEKSSALDLSEHRMRAIVGTTGVGVLIADGTGAATYVNERLAAFVGTDRAALLGVGWLERLHPTDRSRIVEAIGAGMPATGRTLRVSLPEGDELRWLSVRLQPVTEGSAGELVAVVEDVTERVRADRRLRAADRREERLRRKIDGLAERLAETHRVTRSGTWDLDPRTGEVTVSPGLRDLLRLPEATVPGDRVWQRVHPDDVRRAMLLADEALRTGRPQQAEVRLADPDGIVHELIVSCRPTRDNGPLWGVTQDVSDDRAERIRVELAADRRAETRARDRFRRAMLPGTLPTVDGLDLAADYLTAPDRLDAGGDWYDAFATDDGGVVLSVGAVAGGDEYAAAVMGRVRGVLRAYALEDPEPAAILARLNRYLMADGVGDGFVTTVVARYRPSDHRLSVANGGHPMPLLVTCDDPDGEVSRVARLAVVGPALGVLARPEFAVQRMTLDAGAAFCAFTDGLTDRPDPAPDDDLRLPRALARAWHEVSGEGHPASPARRIVDLLCAELLGGADPHDDVCIAVLHRFKD
ncbi:hypothetical protein Val02_51500 [Virgisporangium aliadipatigenens]|uniref:PAS domain S-box-containing protein n=1 Tax=Virgisporangium aliadipatigenens TaxID=741659 RepID=A0A8J4DS21_9ACTN|nr:SpoIIE family protein phosphatase [Virgisporangium aliadipatigenens]GIJ48264.1 hypothetical protein Val02_51500 [Virgisporangium aliadipatigenens]